MNYGHWKRRMETGRRKSRKRSIEWVLPSTWTKRTSWQLWVLIQGSTWSRPSFTSSRSFTEEERGEWSFVQLDLLQQLNLVNRHWYRRTTTWRYKKRTPRPRWSLRKRKSRREMAKSKSWLIVRSLSLYKFQPNRPLISIPLSIELEVTSARSATAANAQVAEEKAALEKRVHKLSMELQQAQLELEKEKESRSSAVLADSTNGKASAASKIARPVRSRFLITSWS